MMKVIKEEIKFYTDFDFTGAEIAEGIIIALSLFAVTIGAFAFFS